MSRSSLSKSLKQLLPKPLHCSSSAWVRETCLLTAAQKTATEILGGPTNNTGTPWTSNPFLSSCKLKRKEVLAWKASNLFLMVTIRHPRSMQTQTLLMNGRPLMCLRKASVLFLSQTVKHMKWSWSSKALKWKPSLATDYQYSAKLTRGQEGKSSMVLPLLAFTVIGRKNHSSEE